MPDYLIPAAESRIIPVTRGADVAFTVQRTNTDGDPVNYDAGAQVYIQVDVPDKTNPTKVQATVGGSTAAIRMDYTLCDTLKASNRWQVIMKVGSAETALLVGRFERNDG